MIIVHNKLDFIRSFVPEKIPDFHGTESTYDYITWNLYDRISRGLHSFAVLCDAKSWYDAVLIAGNVLETASILSYIKDNSTETERTENFEKYLARCAAGRLLATLSMADNLEQEHAWDAYTILLKLFYPVGHHIIKNKEGMTPKEKHEIVIKQINYRLGNNKDKIKIIIDNYRRPDPEGYVRAFSKRMNHLDNGWFEMTYQKYCDFKHVNFMSPGTLTENIDEDTVDWFTDLMVAITGYLLKFKLEPCITKQ